MKRNLFLGLATLSLVASSAVAGTLTLNKNTYFNNGVTSLPEANISKEWVLSNPNNADVNVTLSDLNMTFENIKYNPLSNPVVNMTFTGAKNVKVNTTKMDKVYICRIDSNGNPVKDAPAVLVYNNVYNNVLSFKAVDKDKQASNGFSYGFFYDINESNCSQTADGNSSDNNSSVRVDSSFMTVGLDSDTLASVGVNYVLASGDSQEPQDTGSLSPLLNIMQQFCAGVDDGSTTGTDDRFNAKIAPTDNFLSFGISTSNCFDNSCSSSATLSNSVKITIHSNKGGCLNPNYEVDDIISDFTVTADNALPIDTANLQKPSVSTNGNLVSDTFKNDSNKTFTWEAKYNGLNTSKESNATSTLTLLVNHKDVIPVTKFTADVKITTNTDSNKVNKAYVETFNGNDAGSWTYSGSPSKTIPYVVSSSDTKTAIRVVNTDTKNAGIAYWTCTDDNGVTVANLKVPAADTKTAEIKANGSAAWLAKDILAAAQNVNADFAPNGKMTCSVMITNSGKKISVVPIMTINGARDRVIPLD